jgi:hypothetical protein
MSNDSPQFVWPTSFVCTVITDKVVVPNSYALSISIEPISTSAGAISVGFKKLRHFVDSYLHNSVLIHKDNPLAESFKEYYTSVVLLPSDPYDYFVGGVLYSKFLAITENNFHIDLLAIDSAIGDHIQYNISDPEECGLDLSGDYWWNADSPDTGFEPDANWDDLDINEGPKFEPRIIKGGRSEN